MYAIIKTGGKQYKVQEGDVLNVELVKAEVGSDFAFEQVLMVSTDDDKAIFGKPFVEGAKVEATLVANGKADKVIVFKYKAKKDERKKTGHRQPYARVQINKIVY